MLSVIIPTYNRPDFVVECVRSLKGCGIDELEIIVVDDGSTDNTKEVVEGLGGCRYLYQKNQGPAAARNNGLSICQGDYVAFVDSDDRWLPGVASEVLELFDRHPEVDVVFTDAEMGNDKDGYRSWIEIAGEQTFKELPSKDDDNGFRVLDPDSFFERMIVRNAVFISAVILRKSALDRCGEFSPELCGAADWELWLRLASKLQYGFFPKPLSIYTRHDDCMSNDHDEMRIDFIAALSNVRRKCDHVSKSQRDLISKQIAHHLFNHAYSAYDKGEFGLARERFKDLSNERALTARERSLYLATHLPKQFISVLRQAKSVLKV